MDDFHRQQSQCLCTKISLNQGNDAVMKIEDVGTGSTQFNDSAGLGRFVAKITSRLRGYPLHRHTTQYGSNGSSDTAYAAQSPGYSAGSWHPGSLTAPLPCLLVAVKASSQPSDGILFTRHH